MTTATQRYTPRIGIIFDFDLTLAPDSFNALLRCCGIEQPAAWRDQHVRPLVESGWEEILARVYSLAQLSRSGRRPVTRDLAAAAGRQLEPYEGVPAMFGRLRLAAQEAERELSVEFYLVSSGFRDVFAATAIADEFAALWGTQFAFGQDGTIEWVKRIVTHPEKVRYILALAKGLDPHGPNAPADVYRHVAEEDMHLPLDQMIYVGDGGSDMAVFRLLNERGGFAIAVYKSERAEDWPGSSQIFEQRRVQNLARADFSEGSELMRSLTLAVESIARKVSLRRLGKGE